MAEHAAVSPVISYTGQTTAVLDGHRVTITGDQSEANAGQAPDGTWWVGRDDDLWGDYIHWSGSAEQLLLWHLLDDGATLADPCDYCGNGLADLGEEECIVCEGTGLVDSAALAEELDRLYGQAT